MDSEKMIVYSAVYDNTDAALADLEALEKLHDRDMLGKYDAAVVDKESSKPHIVKRVDRPAYRVVPELFGGGDQRRLGMSSGQLGMIRPPATLHVRAGLAGADG